MNFSFTIWMLMPLAITCFAVYVLMNREKIAERNRRKAETSRLPKFMLPGYNDPDGRRNQFAAVGMIAIAIFQFFAFGTGLIE